MEIDVIYQEVAPKLQNYLMGNGCSYAIACDIVQETFLRIWRRRDELSDDFHQVSGLAFTIARNYRNDLFRRLQLEARESGSGLNSETELQPEGGYTYERPGEEAEETAIVCNRLKATLSRMPGQLLEIFVLSRLSPLSLKDISEGTGLSVSNVKVRIHRAKRMFLDCYQTPDAVKVDAVKEGSAASRVFAFSLIRVMMMMAAIDGSISKEELSLYRRLAEQFRGEDAAAFDAAWENSIRAMAYIGFLTELLPRDELVRECAGEMREVCVRSGEFDVRRVTDALVRMANADGDFSVIERELVGVFVRLCKQP